MAKADSHYTYAWFISLNYDQWARSTPWITDQIEANRKAGLLTNDQAKKIWEHHDQVIQQKVDARNKTNPPKVIISTPGVSGSASAPAPSSKIPFPPFLDKVIGGWDYMLGKGKDGAANAVSGVASGTIGTYLLIFGGIFLVVKLFKK